MRNQHRTTNVRGVGPRQGHNGAFNRTLLLVLCAACLIFGYMFLSSDSESARRQTLTASSTGSAEHVGSIFRSTTPLAPKSKMTALEMVKAQLPKQETSTTLQEATTSSDAGKPVEEHEMSSSTKSAAAVLAHANEHLQEAAEKLKVLAKQANAAAGETKAAGDASTDGATATSPAPANATRKMRPPADPSTWPDLLAYSKQQGQPGDTIHVLFTSNGSPYQNFQARIMVGTYNIAKKQPGGEKLVAMTRILHRQTPDEVMGEIDTFRADPLQPECDTWCWFPVADRANAVQQWIDAAHKDHSMVKAPWLLLLETDYVWRKPLLAPGDAYDASVPGLSFRFDYMGPQNPIVAEILKLKCPDCDISTVPGSGPAPVLVRFSDLRAATPLWEELSEWIETHEHAKKQLGWVREMYAWDIGVAANKLNIACERTGETTLIAQPPHDHSPGKASMYHYTWGCILKDAALKEELWKFDKRFYTAAEDALKIPKIPLPPPFEPGLKVHDGTPWTAELHSVMTDMLTLMNNAIETLPDLRQAAS